MSKSFEQLKKQLNQFKEEKEMQDIITNLDNRKAKIKEEMKLHKKLTASVKKAGKQSPGGLDCFKEENMYYSEKQTKDYLAGTSYMETYNEMKNQDNGWD